MISMKKIVVRASLFFSMLTLSLLAGITGFTLYSWEMKDRITLIGLEKSGWADLHLFTTIALALVLCFHLIENRHVIPAYVRTTLKRP
jgi:hypothetical protein